MASSQNGPIHEPGESSRAAAGVTFALDSDLSWTVWARWSVFALTTEVFVALWRKLRLEEKWMRPQFGEQYEAYSRHVAALVPHVI